MKLLIEDLNTRKTKLLASLKEITASGMIITNPYNIFYLFDFFHVSTERPVAIYLHHNGETIAFVPSLEEEEAKRKKNFTRVETYFEFPGKFNIYQWMIKHINQCYKVENIYFDRLSFNLYKVFANEFNNLFNTDLIHKQRLIKSRLEQSFLRKAANYADFIVQFGSENCQPGISELELLHEMTGATIQKMVTELDEIIYVPGGPAGGLIPSGGRTSHPHSLPSARKISAGDTLILSCGANVHGYRVECERTFFVGKPNKRKKMAFNVMAEAQNLGISLMKPGMKCAEIDNQVLDYIKKSGYGDYLRHRTGHGKGLEEHEPPWVEAGDDTELQPGMVLSCEPGIYIDGFSGFRHSDTVIITEKGAEVLTKFSKKIDDLIIDI